MNGRGLRRRNFLGMVSCLSSLGPLEYSIVPRPETLWETTISAPAVPVALSNGNVIASGRDGIFVFDSETGKKKWEYRTDGTPSVRDVTEAVAILRGPRNYLFAVDLTSGTKLWQNDVGKNPLLDSDTNRVVVEDNSELIGLSTIDGETRWRYEVDGSAGFRLVDSETLYVGSSSGEMHAISTRDGSRQWATNLHGSSSGDSSGHVDVVGRSITPAEHPNVVYAWKRGENRLHAVSVHSGSRLWHVTTAHDYEFFAGTITDDAVYFLDGTHLTSIHPVTGAKRWEFQPNGTVEFPLLVTDGVMYFNTETEIYALSAADGSVRWTHEVADDSLVTLAETGHVLSYRGDPDEMYSFGSDGFVRWVRDFDGVLTRVERSNTGKLFVGTKSGRVIALANPPNTLLNTARQTTTEHTWKLGTIGILSISALTAAYLRMQSGRTGDSTGNVPGSFDDFELRNHVHTNGVLEMYEATIRSTVGNDVILERIDVDVSEGDDRLDEFLSAVDKWKSDDRKSTVPVIASGTTPQPWVAFEKLGQNLLTVGPELSVEESVEVISSVIEIVNEDRSDGSTSWCLSPESIYVMEDRCSVSMANLGVSAFVSDVNTQPSVYAPPEQVAHADEKSSQTMVYRLGAITYWLLTNRDPYDGTVTTDEDEYCPIPPSRRIQGLPEELDDVVLTALAYQPPDRFDSPLAFRDALRWATFVS